MFNVLQIWRKFSKDYKNKENIMEEKNDMNLVRIKKCHIIFTHKHGNLPLIPLHLLLISFSFSFFPYIMMPT